MCYVIALGRIPDLLVDITNKIFAERKARRGANPDSRDAKRGKNAKRKDRGEQAFAPTQRPRHKLSRGKVLRAEAQRMDKKIEMQKDLWKSPPPP